MRTARKQIKENDMTKITKAERQMEELRRQAKLFEKARGCRPRDTRDLNEWLRSPQGLAAIRDAEFDKIDAIRQGKIIL